MKEKKEYNNRWNVTFYFVQFVAIFLVLQALIFVQLIIFHAASSIFVSWYVTKIKFCWAYVFHLCWSVWTYVKLFPWHFQQQSVCQIPFPMCLVTVAKELWTYNCYQVTFKTVPPFHSKVSSIQNRNSHFYSLVM